MFNGDEFIAALEPPTIVLDSQTIAGRCLSIDEAAAFDADFEKLNRGELGVPELKDLLTRICVAVQFPAGTAEKLLARLPASGVIAAIVDFSAALQGRKRVAAPAPNQTPGSA